MVKINFLLINIYNNMYNFAELMYEALIAVILLAWVLLVVTIISKNFYRRIAKRDKDLVAVYYTRKLIHITAGGLVVLLVPFLFKSPLIPFLLAETLAVLTYIPHKTGKLMVWFQVSENMYEVNFCIMWGIIVAIAWIIFNNPWYGVIPITFMSFGDAITGIIRNKIYGMRTKAWIGNLGMAIFCVPLGYFALGMSGAIAGFLASIIEHFEFSNIVDDNITVPLISFITILILRI